jgi:hypothetical protein
MHGCREVQQRRHEIGSETRSAPRPRPRRKEAGPSRVFGELFRPHWTALASRGLAGQGSGEAGSSESVMRKGATGALSKFEQGSAAVEAAEVTRSSIHLTSKSFQNN